LREIKFLHFSDLHLDMPFRDIGIGFGTSSSRRQDLKEILHKITFIAAQERVDVILISGDLFEQNYVEKSTINFVDAMFAQIPEIRIFIIPGNHDPYISTGYYKNYGWSSNVCILSNERPFTVVNDLDLCIYGIGFNTYYQDHCPLEILPPLRKDIRNILLIHGTMDMNAAIDNGRYNPVTSENLAGLGMNYIALGHFHNRIDNYKGLNIYNPGSPEPLGFDEPGEHGVYIGKLDHIGKVSIEFRPICKRNYKVIDIDAEGCTTIEQLCSQIADTTAQHDPGNNLLTVKLRGYIDRDLKIDREQIYNYLGSKFYSLKLINETMPDYDIVSLAKQPGITGCFTEKICELIRQTQDTDEKSLLRKALYYGLEALGKGSVYISEN